MTDRQLFYTTAGRRTQSWLEYDNIAGNYTATALYGVCERDLYVRVEIRCRASYTELWGQILDDTHAGRVEVTKRLAAMPMTHTRGERLADIARGILFSVVRSDDWSGNLVTAIQQRAEKLINAAG